MPGEHASPVVNSGINPPRDAEKETRRPSLRLIRVCGRSVGRVRRDQGVSSIALSSRLASGAETSPASARPSSIMRTVPEVERSTTPLA